MKQTFVAPQKELQNLLTSMQPICNKRTTLDITEYILFQVTPRELTLKATDLEISLRSSMTLEKNSVEDTATFLVSGRRIFDIVREMEDSIEFEIHDNHIKLTSQGVKLSLNIRDAQDFPPFPERIENLMDVDAQFMLGLLSKVAFIVPQNHSNAALNGMLLEIDDHGMSMVATDGHCLARVQSPKYTLAKTTTWLLPRRAILEIKKILETSSVEKVFVGTCGNQLVVSGTNFNFFTKLLSETFPAYKTILSKEGFRPAILAKDDMYKTLKRANCFLAGKFLPTRFKFQPGKLDVSLHNKEVGKLDESVLLDTFDGEEIESRFYSPYLLNGLSVFPDKAVQCFIVNGERPIIFESSHDDYSFTYVVMPVFTAQG